MWYLFRISIISVIFLQKGKLVLRSLLSEGRYFRGDLYCLVTPVTFYRYFRGVVTFGTLRTFEFVNEVLWCYHSNETSSAVLSHGTIYLVCSSNFWVCERNPVVDAFKWNLFSSTFTWCYSFFQPFTKRNLVAFSKLTLAISVRERVDAFSFLLNRFFNWI